MIPVFLVCFFLLIGLNGCKEGCVDVVCGPAPPLLIVQVQDTVKVPAIIVEIDNETGDTVGRRDTMVTAVRPISEAVVTLHTMAANVVGEAFATVPPSVADTTYLYNERSPLPSGEFAVVATRGSRADTLTGLVVKKIEGCCSYEVVGSYVGSASLRLPLQ